MFYHHLKKESQLPLVTLCWNTHTPLTCLFVLASPITLGPKSDRVLLQCLSFSFYRLPPARQPNPIHSHTETPEIIYVHVVSSFVSTCAMYVPNHYVDVYVEDRNRQPFWIFVTGGRCPSCGFIVNDYFYSSRGTSSTQTLETTTTFIPSPVLPTPHSLPCIRWTSSGYRFRPVKLVPLLITIISTY